MKLALGLVLTMLFLQGIRCENMKWEEYLMGLPKLFEMYREREWRHKDDEISEDEG